METFSKSTSLKLMKRHYKHYKSTFREISQVFRTLSRVKCLSMFRNDTNYRVVWPSFSHSVLLETHWLWASSFFFKMFKIWCRWHKWKKRLGKSLSLFRYLHLNWELQILAILNRILPIGTQCVNKHCLDFTQH